jgi:HAD superfamily hydrolase (TIGR01662 family)
VELRIDGVVFDLDATLVNMGGFVDWREAHRRARDAYLSSDCEEEMVSRCSERGLFNMLNLVRDEISSTLPEKDVLKIQQGAYDAIESCEVESIQRCELMPGCLTTLNWLTEQGVKLGIATSNSQRVAEQILEREELRHFFTSVIGRRPDLKMKPHPDQILRCCEEMEIDKKHGLMIGDSTRDVLAARAAGIYVIAVPSFFTKREALQEAGVDMMIDSLGELPEVIMKLDGTKATG